MDQFIGIDFTYVNPDFSMKSDIDRTAAQVKFIKFRAPSVIHGDFYCHDKQLTSLEGAPGQVFGNFDCSDNRLTSLQGAPKEVYGHFDCQFNKLTSLLGAPTRVDGYFDCRNNQLTSLEGAPKKICDSFSCKKNQLTSLLGAPIKIGGDLFCDDNPIKSLAGIGTYFKNGYIRGSLVIPGSVTSHVLGILLIPELIEISSINGINVELSAAIDIINKHLRCDRDILECQEELRSAGLREYGKL